MLEHRLYARHRLLGIVRAATVKKTVLTLTRDLQFIRRIHMYLNTIKVNNNSNDTSTRSPRNKRGKVERVSLNLDF